MMRITVRRSPKLAARARILGQLAGYSEAEAVGRLVELWAQCLEEKSDVLDAKYIRAHLGPRGVEALIEADLGERLEDGVRVHGAKDEIEAQERKTDAARRAGEASGRARSTSEPTNARRTDQERPANATSTPRQPIVNETRTTHSPSSDQGSLLLFSEASASSETSRDLQQQGKGQRRIAGPMPKDFAPSEAHAAFAKENQLDLTLEVERCRDWYAGRGQPQKDWSATLRNWLRNEVRYRAERRARGGDGPGGPSRGPSATKGQAPAVVTNRPDGEIPL